MAVTPLTGITNPDILPVDHSSSPKSLEHPSSPVPIPSHPRLGTTGLRRPLLAAREWLAFRWLLRLLQRHLPRREPLSWWTRAPLGATAGLVGCFGGLTLGCLDATRETSASLRSGPKDAEGFLRWVNHGCDESMVSTIIGGWTNNRGVSTCFKGFAGFTMVFHGDPCSNI